MLDIFLPIAKMDVEQRLVYGVVATQDLDNSGEAFDYATSKPHFEKWSEEAYSASRGKSKGNLRAMHGKVAAGKLNDIGFNDDKQVITCVAKVTDDNEWQKCLDGVYTGFSMGGRYEKRWTEGGVKKYTAVPCEVSLVDKPCIKTATFEMLKADGVIEEHFFSPVVWDLKKEQERDEQGRFAGSGGSSDWKSGASADQHPGHDNALKSEVASVVRQSHNDVANPHLDVAKVSDSIRSGATSRDEIAAKHEAVAHQWAERGDHATARSVMNSSMHQSSVAGALREKADSYAKLGKGDTPVFIPTNDALAERGKLLAKAAGVPEMGWLDFADQARQELVAEHSPDDVEIQKSFADFIKGKKGKKADDAKPDDEEDKKDGGKDEDTEKAAMPELKQVWQTGDGKTFAKKSEALAHSTKGETLLDKIEALSKAAEEIKAADDGDGDNDAEEAKEAVSDDPKEHTKEQAYDHGTKSRDKGENLSHNPHREGSAKNKAWKAGYRDSGDYAKADDEIELRKADDAVDLTKFVSTDDHNLVKAELDRFMEEQEKLIPALEKLTADMAIIKSMQRPSAPRTSVIEKGGDINGSSLPKEESITVEAIIRKMASGDMSELDRMALADAAIRGAQKTGGQTRV